MGELHRAHATTPEELPKVDSTGDAYFDPDDIRFDTGLGRLVVPFAQEPYPEAGGGPEPELVSRRGRSWVEKVPLLRHELQIAEVEKWGLSRRGRDEPGMLRDLRWDAAERELRFLTVTGPEVSVVVRRLDATLVVSDEVVGWLRRRHRSSGSTSDAPWDG